MNDYYNYSDKISYEEFKKVLRADMRRLYPEERQTLEPFRGNKKEFLTFRDGAGHELAINLRDHYEKYANGVDYEGILFETIILLHKAKKIKKTA